MDERLKFVARLLEGERMAVLCREFEGLRLKGKKERRVDGDFRSGATPRWSRWETGYVLSCDMSPNQVCIDESH